MPRSFSTRTIASVLPCVAITRDARVSAIVRNNAGQSAWSETTKPRSKLRRRRLPRMRIQPDAKPCCTRRNFDRGFVVSDHADWPALLRTAEDSHAKRVIATHGNTDALVRALNERGIDTGVFRTDYGGED